MFQSTTSAMPHLDMATLDGVLISVAVVALRFAVGCRATDVDHLVVFARDDAGLLEPGPALLRWLRSWGWLGWRQLGLGRGLLLVGRHGQQCGSAAQSPSTKSPSFEECSGMHALLWSVSFPKPALNDEESYYTP